MPLALLADAGLAAVAFFFGMLMIGFAIALVIGSCVVVYLSHMIRKESGRVWRFGHAVWGIAYALFLFFFIQHNTYQYSISEIVQLLRWVFFSPLTLTILLLPVVWHIAIVSVSMLCLRRCQTTA